MPDRLDRRRFIANMSATAVGAAVGYLSTTTAAAGQESLGSLTGRFVFDGAAPERKKLKVDKDVDCCGKFDIRDESLIVDKTGGLANVYVYLRNRTVPIHEGLAVATPEKITLDNRDCIFQPHCLRIWVKKQVFEIINSDPVAQNVAFSPLQDTPANIILPVGKNATWKFSRAQSLPVPIACNYHPWERAYILPRDNPYFTTSDVNGFFRIAGLPVGKWEFQVWHERAGYLSTPQWPKGRFEIEIRPETNELGTIVLAPSKFEGK